MTFPPVGVTAVIAGMAVFNRDAAIVQNRLSSINRVARQMEVESTGAAGAAGAAFAGYASTLVTVGTVAAGAFALAGAAAINFAADYEQSLALTAALTGRNKEELGGLTDVIIDLSRKGTLGMDELAKASTELARSGVDIPDIMGGALEAVEKLTIASGGEIGLQAAAKLTATAMNAFGLSVDDLDRVTTSATVVAQNSALTFTDFGTAVQYAGATFKATGFQIEDLAVAEALLGKNGITGSVAATSLRGVIQRLVRPSKDAAEVMQKYGIHLFNAAGEAVTFDELLKQLNTAFSDQAVKTGKLTEEQRLQAIATLGLQRTGAAFLILANATDDELKQLRDSFARLNIDDLVNKQLDTLNAQTKIAENNIKALAFSFGAEFLPPLTAATKATNDFLRSITNDQAKKFADSIMEAGRNIAEFVGGVFKGFGDLIKAFGLTDEAAQLLKSTLIGLGVIIGVGIVAALVDAVAGWLAFVAVVGIVTLAIAGISQVIHDVEYAFAGWVSQFGAVGIAISHFAIASGDAFGALAAFLTGDFDKATHLAALSFYEFSYAIRTDGGAALQALQKDLQDTGAAWAPWAAQAGTAGLAVTDALTGVSGIVLSLQFLLQGNFPASAAAASQAMTDMGSAFSNVGTTINNAIAPTLNFITGTLFPAFQTASQATSASFFNAFNQLGILSDLQDAIGNVQTAFGLYIQVVQNVASGVVSIIDLFSRLVAGLGAAQSSTSALDGVITVMLLPLKGLTTAIDLLSKGLVIIQGILVQVTGAFAANAAAADQAAPSVSGFATVFQQAGQTISDVSNTIAQAASAVFAALVTSGQQMIAEFQANLTSIVAFVTDAWTQIQSVTAAIWGAIPQQVFSDLGAILDNVTSIMADIVEIVALTWVYIAQGAIAGIGSFVQTVLTLLQNLATALQPVVQAWIDSIIIPLNNLVTLVIAPLAAFAATVLGQLAQLAPQAAAAAAQIAAGIIGGLVSGIISGTASVTGAIRGMMDQAVAAARAAIQSHSPSRVFQDIGETVPEGFVDGVEQGTPDVTAAGDAIGVSLAQGLINALDKMKAPVRASAAGLVDQLLNSFTDISQKSEELLTDVSSKMAKVGESVGQKTNEAIKDAADKIAQTIQDAQDRIYDLQSNLVQSRTDRSRRNTLKDQQDAQRKARKQTQEDADALADHQKDLLDADLDHTKDIAKAKADYQKAVGKATTDEQRKQLDQQLLDQLKSADESYSNTLADIDRKFKASEADRMAKRARDEDDAKFEAALAAQSQQLEDDMEAEALKRSIDRAQKERDARIESINQALDEKQNKLREDAARELEDLRNDVDKRLQVLENDFSKKAADILRKGGAAMEPLAENIQQIISVNFAQMRNSALDFANGVGQAANALRALQQLRSQVNGTPPLRVPDPAQNLGSAGPVYENIPLPQFAHGGIVPGPYGKPVLVIAHGGELIQSLDSAAARMASAGSQGAANQQSNTYNLNLNPTYPTYESPANVSLDMRALIAMARG